MVVKPTSSGTVACSRRSTSPVQDLGRYRARSIPACCLLVRQMLQHVAAQVVADQVREQSKDQVLHPAPGFNPREAARDPLHQALE